jgi:hypothetical protein
MEVAAKTANQSKILWNRLELIAFIVVVAVGLSKAGSISRRRNLGA